MYECVSASCWPLADAVKLGRTTVCEMTALGCYVCKFSIFAVKILSHNPNIQRQEKREFCLLMTTGAQQIILAHNFE